MSKNNAENGNSEGSWWFDRYDYDYRDFSYSRETGSRGWISKLGGYGIYDDYSHSGLYGFFKDNPKQVFQNLLNQLQNSANIIGNVNEGVITVKWSDGTNENSKSNAVIYLSPDSLLNDNREIEEETVDAMTGKIYLASTMRDTVDQDSYFAAQIARAKSEKSSIHRNAVKIWEAIETSIARHKVIEDWVGFSPYICKDSERSSDSKDKVQEFVNASSEVPNIDAAVLAISWNLLNSSDRIRIPDCYKACIDAAADALGKEINPNDRFRVSFSLASKIASLLPNSPPDPEDESSKSVDHKSVIDRKEEDRCDCVDCRKKREKEKDASLGKERSEYVPKVLDSSLLGDRVENKTDESLSAQYAQGDDKNDSKKKKVDIHPEDIMENVEHNFKIAPKGSKSLFNSVLSKHSYAIRSIRNSLSFRNNSMRMPSYGHRSGEIDENALFKINMNDDRIMLRSDVTSEKNIAICLLVDESGSMQGERVCNARNVAITLASALSGVNGIVTSVYGHTAEEDVTGCTIREYFTPRNPDLSSCTTMEGRQENHDGFAIQETANLFYYDYGNFDRKIMFVISDGQPAGSRYGGSAARDHMKRVSDACRSKLGIEVYGIGIDNGYDERDGKQMYGEGNFVILDDVSSSLPIMSRFIRQVAMSIKK
jgi:hypothetical protein